MVSYLEIFPTLKIWSAILPSCCYKFSSKMVTRIWQKKCILTEFSQTKTKLITTANQTYGWYHRQPKRTQSKNTQTASSAETQLTKSRLIDWLVEKKRRVTWSIIFMVLQTSHLVEYVKFTLFCFSFWVSTAFLSATSSGFNETITHFLSKSQSKTQPNTTSPGSQLTP